jgi:hypothetical protein
MKDGRRLIFLATTGKIRRTKTRDKVQIKKAMPKLGIQGLPLVFFDWPSLPFLLVFFTNNGWSKSLTCTLKYNNHTGEVLGISDIACF